MSVAMPDCPANSSGETAVAAAEETARQIDLRILGRAVPIMLPLPLPGPLDYLMPQGAAVPEPGSFVRVTLGSRHLVGVVWDRPADREGEEPGTAVPLER